MKDELLEEEIDIIEAFDYEMSKNGHKGYYSFNTVVDNGYFIYCENDCWVVEFYSNKKVKTTKKYTNIYNLCLDILKEMKLDDFYFCRRDFIMPRGTKVIITKSDDCPLDDINHGVIISSFISTNKHNQRERMYKVLGSDGNIYCGIYGLKIYGDVCFSTMEDYVNDVEKEIQYNNESIRSLVELNWNLFNSVQDVMRMKEKYLEERVKRK